MFAPWKKVEEPRGAFMNNDLTYNYPDMNSKDVDFFC